MRFRLLLTTVAIGLMLVLAATLVAQAQIQSLSERNSFWQTEPAINLPVTLCHIPPGNPDNPQTIEVSQAAVPAHLAHGDTLGECPAECPPYPAMVAKTGQIKCWRIVSGSSQIPRPLECGCTGTGQDGEHEAGVSADPRFTDNGDGTVTDNLTGLLWLQNAHCWDPPDDWSLSITTWDWALSMANNLENGLCGLADGSMPGDWRLPNIKELQSLIDYGRYDPALPLGHPFFDVQSSCYWSSTTVAPECVPWPGAVPFPCSPLNNYRAYYVRLRPASDLDPSVEVSSGEKGFWWDDLGDGREIHGVQGASCTVWPVRGPE